MSTYYPKEGDVVHVRATVEDGDPYVGYVGIKFADGFCISLPLTSIIHVEPRKIAVGDHVRYGSSRWTVIAIAGEKAWVEREGEYDTANLKCLWRI